VAKIEGELSNCARNHHRPTACPERLTVSFHHIYSGRLSLQPLRQRAHLPALRKPVPQEPRAGNGHEHVPALFSLTSYSVSRVFSIEAAVVVFCISALMMLAFAAFRMKRNAVYAQQIA
jgi:hypothetical protein